MKFCELTEEEFREFLNHHPMKSFLQLPEMAQYKKNHHCECFFVGMKKGEKIVCATMMSASGNFFHKRMFYAQNGFLMDYEDVSLVKEFTKEIKRFIKKKKGYILVIDPYLPLQERDIDGNLVEGGFDHRNVISILKENGYQYRGTSDNVKYMFVLDVEKKTEEELLKAMNSNARRSIQKALKKGIIVREAKKEELPIFKELTDSSANKHHFFDPSLSYYEEMYDLLVPKGLAKFVFGEVYFPDYIEELEEELKNIKIPKKESLGQKKERETRMAALEKRILEAHSLQKEKGDHFIISGGLFILYGEEVVYLFGGNLKEYSHFGTAYGVQWEMIKYALKNHYKLYNFYGILTTKKEDKDYGVYSFKRGFNGYVVELIGEFALPITPHYYLRKFIRKTLKK